MAHEAGPVVFDHLAFTVELYNVCDFPGIFSEFRPLFIVEGVVVQVDIDVGVGEASHIFELYSSHRCTSDNRVDLGFGSTPSSPFILAFSRDSIILTTPFSSQA